MSEAVTWKQDGLGNEKRDVWQSIRRGITCRCPNCNSGKLFNGYLTVAPECPSCAENLSHEQAHDFPPYITIMIVGHIVVTLLMIVEARYDWSLGLHLAVWVPLTFLLSVALLRPVKGGVVGLQWALRMGGFGDADQGKAA